MTDAVARILVTNVDTPLGLALVQALLATPGVERVIGWCSKGKAGQQTNSDPRLRFEEVDAHHDRELWRALFGAARELEIDCVIHDPIAMLAGHEPKLDWRKVTEEGRRLLLHCAEHPTIRRFVLRSSAEVYRLGADLPLLIREDHPLDMTARTARVRGLVESDLYTCSRMSDQGLQIVVLRCAEVLGPELGSQLFDYLCAPVCLRALGFDPMLALLSVTDAARALASSALRDESGVFNITGLDVMPLSRLIALVGRTTLPLPDAWLTPLYLLRAWTTGSEFRYPGHADRFHHAGVLDGRLAQQMLDVSPLHRIDFTRLATEVSRALKHARWPAALQNLRR